MADLLTVREYRYRRLRHLVEKSQRIEPFTLAEIDEFCNLVDLLRADHPDAEGTKVLTRLARELRRITVESLP